MLKSIFTATNNTYLTIIMPDKHRDNKKKNEPKEQRKTRNRNQKVDRKAEKSEEVKPSPRVITPQKPPVYEDPGPEFYKSLKRETDEIVKITEEENSKYKKKEIQSNWAKYEMPIESYEETEEQDVGADYDKLIQMPLSVGGHFQFKHEKSWDTATGPSPYDKYFNINMDNLAIAVQTSPFYERNQLDKDFFTETDILTMDNRAMKYKQKYFKDKKYSTAETEGQDRILNSLKTNDDKIEISETNSPKNIETEVLDKSEDIVLETFNKYVNKTPIDVEVMNNDIYKPETKESSKVNEIDDLEELLEEVPKNLEEKEVPKNLEEKEVPKNLEEKEVLGAEIEVLKEEIPAPTNVDNGIRNNNDEQINEDEKSTRKSETKPDKVKTEETPVVVAKTKPVIESPEDLEKWLDDFLDG